MVGISFFVGFRAGAAQFEPEPNPSISQILPEADQQATLESLLRQIEDAQQSGDERPFQFPSELPSNEAREVPEPPPKEGPQVRSPKVIQPPSLSARGLQAARAWMVRSSQSAQQYRRCTDANSRTQRTVGCGCALLYRTGG